MGIFSALWKFLASVRLTIAVLLSLAATSIIGTLVPQNESPAAYFKAFGPYGYRLLEALDVFDMYHAWWFQLLLLFLVANILVCSIDRLATTGRIIFTRQPRYRAERFRKSTARVRFDAPAAPAEIEAPLAAALGRRFGRLRIEACQDGRLLFAERWRWSRLGVYAVHASVVLLVAGGLIGSLLGFEGYVNIAEGDSADTIELRRGGHSLRLPFAIRCNDFDVSFYPNGAPKEYRSDLSLLRDGNVIGQKQIIVNDPLRFEGISIFQSSYGKLPPQPETGAGAAPDRIELEITSRRSAHAIREQTGLGRTVPLPDDLGTVTVDAYLPMAEFMGQPLGPALQVTVNHPGEAPAQVLLPLRFAAFDKMRRGRVVIVARVASATAPADRYYTGLQVTRDPGVKTVYVGFLLMIAGCLVTFFMAHQQICVDVQARGAGSAITVYGVSNRNKMALQRRLDRLARQLAAAAGSSQGSNS